MVRTDTHQRFYPITDFLKGGPRYDNGRIDRSCISSAGEPGLLFVQSDTGFRDDLFAFISTIYTKTADIPIQSQASSVVGMTHTLKFEIVTGGNVTPAWKLVRVNTTSSPLFGTSRDRTQNLIITLGPAQTNPGTKQKSLATAAQSSQSSAELAAAIASALRSN